MILGSVLIREVKLFKFYKFRMLQASCPKLGYYPEFYDFLGIFQ
ncbi:Uncharacterized protein dnm_003560 [Desulfonema magnum]|uniref:Uncharacterized protein n=1 Tax=Desulfonema magnum TaxID=45655 RepID=A0A975BFA8_9BACT|nr:Uncharacterized protein dnm_003560 [Desulfonema magnum]